MNTGPVIPDIGLEQVAQGASAGKGRAFFQWGNRYRVLRFGSDILVLVVALVCAELSSAEAGMNVGVSPVAFTLLVLALLQIRGVYGPRLRMHVLDDIRVVVSSTALAAMVILTLEVVLAEDPQPATIRLWAFGVAFLACGRVAVDMAEIRARQRRRLGRLTLIIGAGRVGRLVAKRLAQYPKLGLQPVGLLDDAPWLGEEVPGAPVLGGMADLDDVVRTHRVEHVVVTFSADHHEALLRIVGRCEQLGITVSFVPRLFEKMKEKVSIESVGSIPLIFVAPTDPRSWQFAVKYILDRVVAAALLVLVAPLFVGTAIAVWGSSGRPILYRQVRVGRDGRRFEIFKFRSMRVDEHRSLTPGELPPDTAPGGAEGAERTTRVGSVLRRTALDELPQLLNVVRGEMSLVGPRPERPDFVEVYASNIPRYSDRHRVKAGMTGWAQVNDLRGNTSLSDRAEWDNFYIDNFSLWLDLKILLSTASALVRSPSEAPPLREPGDLAKALLPEPGDLARDTGPLA